MKDDGLRLRVRYAETDQMGVVYYANYLIWFETARTEFFRDRGMVYDLIEKERGLYLPVIEAQCSYKAPLKYDDEFIIYTRLGELGRSRIVFEYEIKKDGRVTTSGYTKHVFIDVDGRPVPVPEDIKKALDRGQKGSAQS